VELGVHSVPVSMAPIGVALSIDSILWKRPMKTDTVAVALDTTARLWLGGDYQRKTKGTKEPAGKAMI